MKVKIYGSTNTVKHTTLRLTIYKYGRNFSEVDKLTAYPITPNTRDSEMYNFALTKETKQTYTRLYSLLLFQEVVAGRIFKLSAHECRKLDSPNQWPPFPTRIYC